MASGKTLQLIALSRYGFSQLNQERKKVVRDRSLRGKDRIRARRAENKASRG
jgi:predicted ATPase